MVAAGSLIAAVPTAIVFFAFQRHFVSGLLVGAEQMSWVLPTATGRYVVDLAPGDAGPVLQDWTDGDIRDWGPSSLPGLRDAAGPPALEVSALGSRQVRGADLIVDHGNGLLGARLVWPDDAVEVVADGPLTRLTARGHDTTGDLGVMLEIHTCSGHDVVIKQVTLTNTGRTRPVPFSGLQPGWELPIGPGAIVHVLAGDWGRGVHGPSGRPAGRRAVHRQPPRHHLPPLRPDAVPGLASRTGRPGVRDRAGLERLVAAPRRRLPVPGSGPSGRRHRRRVDRPSTRARRDVHDPGHPRRVRARRTRRPSAVAGTTTSATGSRVTSTSRGARSSTTPGTPPRSMSSPTSSSPSPTAAAELGVEVFVVDDGWFAGRTSDRTGLGNWWPDPVKFPDGLDPLITGVLARGLRFGIWVEPEAVSPDADILAEHPDWIYRAGDRPLITIRNQYVLDFGRRAVLEWTEDWLRRLLNDRRITYLKWDMNRPITDGGRPGDRHGRQWAVQHTPRLLPGDADAARRVPGRHDRGVQRGRRPDRLRGAGAQRRRLAQ